MTSPSSVALDSQRTTDVLWAFDKRSCIFPFDFLQSVEVISCNGTEMCNRKPCVSQFLRCSGISSVSSVTKDGSQDGRCALGS